MKKALIIGGGIGGCVSALELSKRGWDVLIAEGSNALGGGLRTITRGGHPCTFGPRHFLTQNENVFKYLNDLVPLRLCAEHEFYSYVSQDKNFYSYPIHFDDIPRMPDQLIINSELNDLDKNFRDQEYKLTTGVDSSLLNVKNYRDFWLKSVGTTLYTKFIQDYTRKMWMLDDETIIDDFTWSPKGVAIKKGPRAGWDSAISAYPIASDGYNKIFDITADTVQIKYQTNVEIDDPLKQTAFLNGQVFKYDSIINTVPLDTLFGNCFGVLKFIGRDLEYLVLPVPQALPDNVYFAYYCGDEKYTRITEYKKFTKHISGQTLISIEYPSNNGRYYPLPVQSEKNKFQKYNSLLGDNFKTIGRSGLFNYRYDIDDVIEQALQAVDSFD
jgi:UDP-galactopyranose mutase